jgi:hypothetical protein
MNIEKLRDRLQVFILKVPDTENAHEKNWQNRHKNEIYRHGQFE